VAAEQRAAAGRDRLEKSGRTACGKGEVFDKRSRSVLIEVRRAFRSRAKEFHPDKGGRATEFHASQQAYEFLSTKWSTAWAVAEQEERCTQAKFHAAAESTWEDLGGLGENCVNAEEDWFLVD